MVEAAPFAEKTVHHQDAHHHRPTLAGSKKCGPGQPPEPHCLAGYPGTHFLAGGMGRCDAPKSSDGTLRSADRHSRSVLHESLSSSAVAAASPAVCGGLEAATPGQPVHVETRSGGTLPVIHLENYPEPPALPQCSGRARRTSRLNVRHCAPRLGRAAREKPRAAVQKL